MSDSLRELAELVRRETGNDLPAGRLPFLAEAAERRARSRRLPSLPAYIEALRAGELRGEWEALASLLTIKESTFFRVPQQWERLATLLVPELVQARAASRRLRCWSAACAAGEEPATLAMVLADSPLLAGWDWRILATDLDPEALGQARRGLYGARAVAAVPPRLRERWLSPRGELFELDARLRERIDYQPLNLARPPWRLDGAPFDLIFLRNVLIYFRPELQRAVVRAVEGQLAEDGALFLGGSETLWRVQERLRPVDLGDCWCYRLLPVGSEVAPVPVAPSERPSSRAVAPSATRRPARRSGSVAGSRAAAPVSPAPAERRLAAASLIEADRLAEAGRELALALDDDPADPTVHVLLGIVGELERRDAAAADAYRAALYLEPGLAQVRLLLAGCLQRLGEAELARRQLREAVAALESEGGRRLPLLEGRFVPPPAEALQRARAALAAPIERRKG